MITVCFTTQYVKSSFPLTCIRGAGTIADRSWLDSGSSWLKVSPFGFRRILNFIKEEYGNPPIIITENGISERGPVNLTDIHRSHYFDSYINQLLKGIKQSYPIRQGLAHIYIILYIYTYMYIYNNSKHLDRWTVVI